MYRMQNRKKDIRIYVRNKARYNPETKERDFLYVDITDFAGTTIGDIKENMRRQTRGAVKIDELFLNNVSLADDRSVAHYNLEDGSILETTSNPLWVSCLYIKAEEVKQQQRLNPADENVQKWTSKSLPKKYTIIGILLNSSNAYRSQPPHFPNLQDLVLYLESLGKKGATMHPNYTRADLAKMELEFHRDFETRFDDPIAAFIDHHAVQLGYINPDEAERKLRQPAQVPMNRGVVNYPTNQGAAVPGNRAGVGGGNVANRNKNNRKQVQICEDCETSLAVVYCTDCQNAAGGHGISLCKHCSDLLHTGATRRGHNIADVSQVPKAANSKPYVPRAFLAPFSILVAMYSALTDRVPKLSMTEDDIKLRAQSLTDTDLQDKQNGKYVGGFDCMENCLMAKGLVKKEASRTPTYALTDLGHALGEKLFLFSRKLFDYLSSISLPKLPDTISSTCVGNRKICLLIDENEREKGRLLKFAEDKGIDAQTRYLPAGDYIWILTPPMINTRMKYTGKQPDTEVVLPFIVERKSWEDFENSVNSTRFQRQVNNMLGSGVKNCFYLMEGSPGALRYNATQQHQQQLKTMVEKLTYDYGFYVNYTASWMKSAQWLLWFTQLIVEAYKQGKHVDSAIPYSDFNSRVAILNGGHPPGFHGNQNRQTHTWPAQLFVDHIFRDELGERTLIRTVQEDIGQLGREKHLLVIKGLEQYNKSRQSTLNKCCTEVHDKPQQAGEIVNRMIGDCVHNMVHYDITCYKQLYIQVMTGVYIMRTETDKERDQAHQGFMAGPKPPPPASGSNRPTSRQPPRKQRSPKGTSSSSIANILAAVNPFTTPSHTDAEDCSLNVPSRLTADREVGHDLPPGCRVANTLLPRQPALSSSRSERGQNFEAFSGTGFALGSGASGRNPRKTSKPTATVTSEIQIAQLDNRARTEITRAVSPIDRLDDRNLHQIGPSGDNYIQNYNVNRATGGLDNNVSGSVVIPRNRHVSRSGDGTDNVGNRLVGLGDSDMVGSLGYSGIENEDQIFQEVLNKSKQEAGTIATDSQDDPELQLALMLSREDNHSSATLDQSRHNSYQSIDKYSPNRENPERDKTDAIEIEDSQEDMDDSIRLALEMSKFDDKDLEKGNMVGVSDVRGNVYRDQGSGLTDSSGKKTVISIEDSENVAEEELELKLAIEMSKQTNTPEKLIDTDSDLHVLEAIERSKIDHTPEKAAEFDHHLIAALEMSIQENSLPNADHEDSYLKEVIERSKVDHTPKKVAAYDFELEKAILMSIVEHTPKKVENEDRHLKLAIEQSIVEQSLKLTAVKRKLDTSDMCDIRKKISRNNGDIQRLHEKESDPLNVKEAERFCRTNQLKAMEAREIESEVVILIDSQSQESEEAEMDSLSVPEIADTETGLSDSLSKSLIDNSSLDLRQDQRQIDTTENPSECFRKSPVDTDTHCDIVNDAIDSRRDDDNHEQDDDDDDFIPPSPDKSTSNLSQLNASHQSNGSFTPISTLLSGSRKEETESSKEESESEKLESAKVMRTYTNNGHYEQTEKTNKDRGESKVTDFSLKTSLLRFVDDNASESDYDSCDDDDFDDYVGAGKSCSDNDSFESADDMFTQPDCDSESNVGPKKLSNVQNENTNTVQVPYVTKNVPNIWRVSNLVNLPVRNESSHSPSKLCSKRGNSLERQPNTDGSLFERDKNVSPTKTIVANIKKEKDVDANKVSLENNYSNMDVQKRESNISPKRKGTVAIKQKPSDQIASKIDVQKGFSDFYSTYDSQMDEIDFNPDLDDIDNDPTYEAGKNDMDSSESSDDISDDDEGDDLDELISKVDPEFLPPISRPKKRRKKTPKKDSTKKTATSPKTKSVQIKQENLDGLDVQVKVEKSDRPDVSTETDKALAKLLDKQINKRTGSSTNSSKDYIADNDELFARQVKTEIDSDLPDLYVDTVNDEKLAKQYQTVLNSGTPDRNETEELIRELQRRELEKLERMRRTLEEDERIARMIQDNPDQDQGRPYVNPTDIKDAVDEKEKGIPRNYKKLIAEVEVIRERATAQVDEYRRIQSQRYQLANTPGHTPGNSIYGKSLNDRANSSFNDRLLDIPSQSLSGSLSISQPQAGQLTPSNRINQSQNSNFSITQSETGQLTPHSQLRPSAAERSVNSTCGNCGEKGHTRVNPNCPRYHTAEETARRDAQLEIRRQKQEEKKREEQENINMLSRHQRAILEMNNQIQAEVSAIQNNLNQRARELERQVNSRVKKIENAEKRKKKK